MDRRTHYLTVAQDLFSERGFNGVSMDEIVERSGGSKATIYRYFSSKRDLFLAMTDELSTASFPPDAEARLDALPLEEALDRVGRLVASGALAERAVVLLRLAVSEVGRFPELGRVLFDRGPSLSYAMFGRLVERRVAAGELEVEDPEIAAEQFLGGIVGHQQLRMALGVSTPTANEVEARVRAAVASFLATYGVPR